MCYIYIYVYIFRYLTAYWDDLRVLWFYKYVHMSAVWRILCMLQLFKYVHMNKQNHAEFNVYVTPFTVSRLKQKLSELII